MMQRAAIPKIIHFTEDLPTVSQEKISLIYNAPAIQRHI
jgi:hypothetical protein